MTNKEMMNSRREELLKEIEAFNEMASIVGVETINTNNMSVSSNNEADRLNSLYKGREFKYKYEVETILLDLGFNGRDLAYHKDGCLASILVKKVDCSSVYGIVFA